MSKSVSIENHKEDIQLLDKLEGFDVSTITVLIKIEKNEISRVD